MKIQIGCPCGKQLIVPEAYAGKRVKCPTCSQPLEVPISGEPPDLLDALDTLPVTTFPVSASVVRPSQGFAPHSGTSYPPSASGASAARANRRCHELDYQIVGDDLQMVIIELDPGETVIAEAGAMTYMEEGIQFETKMGDGSAPDSGFLGKVMSAGKRAITGESIFMTHFTHRGSGKSHVAFAAPYPGKIIPIDLSTIAGNDLICQKDAFLCAALGTQVTVTLNKKIGAGLFGGEGFILQKLVGDGLAFIHAGGTIIQRELRGEILRVDTGCLVAFEPHIEYNIERAGNLKSMFFGGEGLFLATLRGHGRVWLQSLPMRRLAQRIIGNAGASGKGEGSILGSLGNLLDGD